MRLWQLLFAFYSAISKFKGVSNEKQINYTDDPVGIVGAPLLGGQAGLVLPRWNPGTGQFADGSATIREAFERLVWLYGMPAEGSPAIDAADPSLASSEDILGRARPEGVAPDVGAVKWLPPLVLRGAPSDELIRLSWTLNVTIPATSTWQISYDGSPGDQLSPIAGIGEPTRAYTLTGLTNYTWYTVTLNDVLDGTPVLTDTATVMPTDLSTYLPLVVK